MKVSIRTPEDFKAFVEQRWPLSRIRNHCTPENRTSPPFQNLVHDQHNYGSLFHERAHHDFGTVYWYAVSKDKRNWEYSINVRKASDWWLLELGTLTSEEEIADHPAFRMGGPLWEEIWDRVGKEGSSVRRTSPDNKEL
jgi:hypothetical protein